MSICQSMLTGLGHLCAQESKSTSCLYTLAPWNPSYIMTQRLTHYCFLSQHGRPIYGKLPMLLRFQDHKAHHRQALIPSDSTPRVSGPKHPARNVYPYQRPTSRQTRSYDQPHTSAFRGEHLAQIFEPTRSFEFHCLLILICDTTLNDTPVWIAGVLGER